MNGDLSTDVLKGVSRSFYLTLRLLPSEMRNGASAGYLLARTTDTIADTAGVSVKERLALLDAFGTAVKEGTSAPVWPAALLGKADPKEAVLLTRSEDVLNMLSRLPAEEGGLARDVVETIISGQRLDLERFEHTTPAEPVTLENDAELEDYAWRVAGCVGEFWTRLGFLTLGSAFSTASEEVILAHGAAYGKGLQLVNILRDVPRDLSSGRCYLPVANPWDRKALLESHAHWLKKARAWIGEGEAYAATLPMRRLRAATVLPAWLANETLDRLAASSWADLERRVKIPRKRVYSLLWKAWWK